MNSPTYLRSAMALVVFCASAFSNLGHCGFADPVVRDKPSQPGYQSSQLLDLRAYCKNRYGRQYRYYPDKFSCGTGIPNEAWIKVVPDEACQWIHGKNAKAAQQYTDLVCVTR